MSGKEKLSLWMWLNPQRGLLGELAVASWLITFVALSVMPVLILMNILYGLIGTEYGARGEKVVYMVVVWFVLVGAFVLVTRWINDPYQPTRSNSGGPDDEGGESDE